MIGYVDIKKAVIDKLKANFSNIKPVANEELSGFKPPAFFVQMMPINDTGFNDYEEKLLTINIHYFSAEKTDLANLKMLDQLNLVFFNTLIIGDRTITLKGKKHQIIDNVLQFKFDLEFAQMFDQTEVNGEYVSLSDFDESLAYTEEQIKLMEELEIKEV